VSPRDSTTSVPYSSEAELSSTAVSSAADSGGEGDEDADDDDDDYGDENDEATKRMASADYQLPVQQHRVILYSDSDYSDPYELSGMGGSIAWLRYTVG
jgi:hypothetical protein